MTHGPYTMKWTERGKQLHCVRSHDWTGLCTWPLLNWVNGVHQPTRVWRCSLPVLRRCRTSTMPTESIVWIRYTRMHIFAKNIWSSLPPLNRQCEENGNTTTCQTNQPRHFPFVFRHLPTAILEGNCVSLDGACIFGSFLHKTGINIWPLLAYFPLTIKTSFCFSSMKQITLAWSTYPCASTRSNGC